MRNTRCLYLLFKISSILLVDKHKIQVITSAELLVDIPERRCKVETTEEQPYRDRFPLTEHRFQGSELKESEQGLTSDWGTIHDFEFGNRLAFVVLVGRRTCCFTTDDRQLHMLDLYSNQEEVNLANNNIFQMISDIVVVRIRPAGYRSSRTSTCCTRIRYGDSLQYQPPSLLSYCCQEAFGMSEPRYLFL